MEPPAELPSVSAPPCDVELIPGFDLVSQWLDLPGKLDRCDWLITGEGKFDASSLAGKGPGTLARKGLALGKKVSVLAGRIEVTKAAMGGGGKNLDLIEISPRDLPLQLALERGPEIPQTFGFEKLMIATRLSHPSSAALRKVGRGAALMVVACVQGMA